MSDEQVAPKKKRWWLWLILLLLIAAAVFVYLTYFARQTGPCGPEIYFVGTNYSNPQENLDPAVETTWMVFTFTGGKLTNRDRYIYYWDTRPMGMVDSFNNSNGTCQVYPGSMQIECRDLPLAGLDDPPSIPFEGYEYTISLQYDSPECEGEAVHMQQGLIYMETLEHVIVKIKGRFMP